MNDKRIQSLVDRAQQLSKAQKDFFVDRRYLDTIGFFKAKGLLWSERVKANHNVKLDLVDVLWVAENVEPRVYEILPAAFLHYPRSFFNIKALPKEMKQIIFSIKKNMDLDFYFKGIRYQDMLRWANIQLSDGRVKPVREKKVMRSFRFTNQAIQQLKKKASELQCSETEYLEQCILK